MGNFAYVAWRCLECDIQWRAGRSCLLSAPAWMLPGPAAAVAAAAANLSVRDNDCVICEAIPWRTVVTRVTV